jgi:hypothetical protein
VSITVGSGNSGAGGAVAITAGRTTEATKVGGKIEVTGGIGATGGDVILKAGAGPNTAASGAFRVRDAFDDTDRFVIGESAIALTASGTTSLSSVSTTSISTTAGNSNIALSAHGTGKITGTNPVALTVAEASNGVADIITMTRSSTIGPGAAGLGSAIAFELETGIDVIESVGKIELLLEGTKSAEIPAQSKFVFKTLGQGTSHTVLSEAASITHAGMLTAAGGVTVTTGGVTLSTAQTVTTTTGSLTLASGGGNGDILLTPDGTGKVGLGTSAPITKMHIQGSDSSTTSLPTGTQLAVEFNGDTGLAIMSPQTSMGNLWFSSPRQAEEGFIKFSHTADATVKQYMALGVGSADDGGTGSAATEKVRITDTGRLGVGMRRVNTGVTTTDTPLAALHVKNDNFVGMATADSSAYLAGMIESTDTMLQLVGSDDGKHVASIVLSAKPDSGDNKHWVMMHKGPTATANANGFVIGYVADANGVSGTNVEDLANNFLTITTAGKVGIGVANPTLGTLQVLGSVDASSFTSNGVGLGSSSDTYWNTVGSGTGNIYYSGGNVGIGSTMTAPLGTLHLRGTGETSLLVQGGTTANSAALLQFQPTGTALGYIDYEDNNLAWRSVASDVKTTHMTLDTAGNLGIGTITPIRKLHVSMTAAQTEPVTAAANSDAMIISGNTANLELLSRDTNLATAASIGFGRYKDTDGTLISKFGIVAVPDTGSQNSNLMDRLSFTYGTSADTTANTEFVSISRTGKLGLGLTAPPAQLSVSEDIFVAATSNAWPTSSNWPASKGKGLYMRFYTNTANGVTNDYAYIQSVDQTTIGGGNVVYHPLLIDASKLLIANAKVGIGVSPDYTLTYELDVNGIIAVNGDVVHSSDRRFKKNITTIAGAMDKVRQLSGVTYDWRKDEFPHRKFPDGNCIGVIAQEVSIPTPPTLPCTASPSYARAHRTAWPCKFRSIALYSFISFAIVQVEKVAPSLVVTDKEGYKSVTYAKMTPLLLQALKEQDSEITDLKSQLTQMKAVVCALSPTAPFCAQV